jgi:hypothetical protein
MRCPPFLQALQGQLLPQQPGWACSKQQDVLLHAPTQALGLLLAPRGPEPMQLHSSRVLRLQKSKKRQGELLAKGRQ